jgi:hypothetical protein
MSQQDYEKFLAIRSRLPSFFAAYYGCYPEGHRFHSLAEGWKHYDEYEEKYLKYLSERQAIERWRPRILWPLATAGVLVPIIVWLLSGKIWGIVAFVLGTALVSLAALVFKRLKDENTFWTPGISQHFDFLHPWLEEFAGRLGHDVSYILDVKDHAQFKTLAEKAVLNAVKAASELQKALFALNKEGVSAKKILEKASQTVAAEEKARLLFSNLQHENFIDDDRTYKSFWDAVRDLPSASSSPPNLTLILTNCEPRGVEVRVIPMGVGRVMINRAAELSVRDFTRMVYHVMTNEIHIQDPSTEIDDPRRELLASFKSMHEVKGENGGIRFEGEVPLLV